MKYLIVGLGNIGAEYAETRHNIGFKIVDFLIAKFELKAETSRYADYCLLNFKGRQLHLIKPSTYMNLSGKAVSYWMQKLEIPVENIFVLVDDLAIPFGAIRIKLKGSDGGHNGLSHISQTLGHQNFARLRFGIGSDFPKGKQVDYVLGKWNSKELDALYERIDIAAQAVVSISTIGITQVMNQFNGK